MARRLTRGHLDRPIPRDLDRLTQGRLDRLTRGRLDRRNTLGLGRRPAFRWLALALSGHREALPRLPQPRQVRRPTFPAPRGATGIVQGD